MLPLGRRSHRLIGPGRSLAREGAKTPKDGGRLIVITAPLTEIIDHAGYFIQMSMASLPMWLEGILNKKYPNWRHVEHNDDGSARYMPAGARVLETSLLRRYAAADVVCCYPDDVDAFIGPRTRIVAVRTAPPRGTVKSRIALSVTRPAGNRTSSFTACGIVSTDCR